MVTKHRTLYVWEGADTISFTRGLAPQESTDNSHSKDLVSKYRGVLNKQFTFWNLHNMYIGTPKKLDVGRILPGWAVIRIRMGLMNKQPFVPDIPPSIIQDYQSKVNEVEIWKRMYNEERKKNLNRLNEDIFQQQMKRRAENYSEIRQKMMGMSDFGGGGYGGYGGMFGSSYPRYGSSSAPDTSGSE